MGRNSMREDRKMPRAGMAAAAEQMLRVATEGRNVIVIDTKRGPATYERSANMPALIKRLVAVAARRLAGNRRS